MPCPVNQDRKKGLHEGSIRAKTVKKNQQHLDKMKADNPMLGMSVEKPSDFSVVHFSYTL